MTLWAVVPVKPLGRSKSRLAQVLGQEERQALSTSLLIHTLDCLSHAAEIERIAVVSGDAEVARLAVEWGAVFVNDPETGGLNPALRAARQTALDREATRLLVLPADLPRLSAEAISRLTRLGNGSTSAVIAPDRHGSGTNALLTTPPGLIEYAFGPLSFMRHTQLAEAAGVHPWICRQAAFTLDLDLPEDLTLLEDESGEE
jgi:2-phospho-L-lactate guanylyltransferase